MLQIILFMEIGKGYKSAADPSQRLICDGALLSPQHIVLWIQLESGCC